MQTLTLFVSSPGDVRDERQAVGRIVERLQARYWNFIRLEPVLWEKEPLRATAHFNEELIRPSDCDLFVCILWSRLGSPLPSQFNRKDGTRFDSGTEWELEEATDAFEERAAKKTEKAKPDILVYRRMSEPPPGDPDQAKAKREQRNKLDAFCERFFFNKDKTIRRAFSPYETTDEFMSLFEQHLEKLLLRHIQLQRGLSQDAVRPLPLEGSPFKGLGTFEFDDAPLFFGRNRPIAEALAKLKENHAAGHAFLLIYGGSGYGKSSLMKAGMAPRLMADGYLPEAGTWCGTSLLPVEGDAPPLETLARALVEALPDLEKLRDTSGTAAPAPQTSKKRKGKQKPPIAREKAGPVWDSARLARTLGKPEEIVFAIAAIMAALDRVSAGKPAQLLVLVDQLEEIFTAKEITPGMRDAFFHVLAALAMSRRVWVVATMRSEFFPRVPEHKDLFQLVRHGGGYILSPPELPELHQIIRYPALAAGLQFERHPESGRDLSEQIYQDATDADDALPLLEFTLEELYQRRSENVLTWAAYEELGGLAGAIARRAQETYDALPSQTRREAARQIFGELVTLDASHEGPATRRRARRETLHDAHPGAPAFLEAFIEAKLLVTGSENNAATVTLAHEALITHWPVLKQWIEDHRDLLLARRRLEDAARLWSEGRKSPKFYLTEGRLAEAERVASSGVFRVSVEEAELVRLSRARARRKLRIFQAATVVFAGLAIGAGALGLIARQKQQQADKAEGKALESAAATRRSLSVADFDAGAARAQSGTPDEALPFLLAALESNPGNLEAQALLLSTLRQTAWHFPTGEIQHPLPVTQLSFGSDADTLFSSTDFSHRGEGFNSTLRWDLTKPSLEAHLVPAWGMETQTLAVSPGDRRVIIQRGYKRPDVTLLCDAKTLKPVADLKVADGARLTCFAWSVDGALLAYPAQAEAPDRSVTWRIVDSASGQIVRESDMVPGDFSEPLAAQVDRQRMRAVHANGSVIELPLHPAQPQRTAVLDSEEKFGFAVFNDDGTQLYCRMLGRGVHEEGQHALFTVQDEPSRGVLQIMSLRVADSGDWLDSAQVLPRFSWSYWDAPVWKQLFDTRRAGDTRLLQGGAGEVIVPMTVNGTRLETVDSRSGHVSARAPYLADSMIKSVATSGNRMAVGSSSGKLALVEFLPRMNYRWEAVGAPPEGAEDEGWKATKTFAGGLALEQRAYDARLRSPGEGGKIVPLALYPDWRMIVDAGVHPDGGRVVLAGYNSGSGGFVSPGVVVADSQTGKLLSDLEPVDNVRKVDFIGSEGLLAVTSGDEIALMHVTASGFERRGSIPITGAVALFPVSTADGGQGLAIATEGKVVLHDLRDLSEIGVLPMGQAHPDDEEGEVPVAWAEDPQRRWLAFRSGKVLNIWEMAGGRLLVSNLRLPQSEGTMRFGEEGGMLGLRLEVGSHGFLPLAAAAGVTPPQLDALRGLAEGLSGMRFAAGSRSISRLDRQPRLEAIGRDFSPLAPLLPGVDLEALRASVLQLPFVTPASDAWLPLWQRLALSAYSDSGRIARWSSALGKYPWREAYLRSLIADSDRNLFHLKDGGKYDAVSAEDPLPQSADIGNLHHLAGDPEDLKEAKLAAWLLHRTSAAVAGPELAQAESLEETPGMDAEGLAKLDLAALEKLAGALKDWPQNDWRLALIDELKQRPAAQSAIDTYLKRTAEGYAKSKSSGDAYPYLEALMLAGKKDEAFALAKSLGEGDAVPTLAGAHFLLAAGLDEVAPAAVELALEKLGSAWLWRAWIQRQSDKDVPLAAAVERLMKASDGSGVAAIEAFKIALAKDDAEAISACLKDAKNVPEALKNYATARMLWAAGRKAEVFSLWPGEYPDLAGQAEAADWGGWEQTVTFEQTRGFFGQLDAQLATLKPADDAPVEDLRALAARLLDPATADTFGIRRVRDAMVACGLALANDKESGDLISQMLVSARIAGAAPLDCLRIEARSFMAAGEFTAAYSRWLEVIETPDAVILASDYVDAARCVIEDRQDAAAIELLTRGRGKFPANSAYALDSAWLLLATGHAEESGIMLEHGFAIPFSEDQRQVALAMLVCAAEETQRTEKADQALRDLVALSADWSSEESLNGLDWPEALKQSLLAVAKRNR